MSGLFRRKITLSILFVLSLSLPTQASHPRWQEIWQALDFGHYQKVVDLADQITDADSTALDIAELGVRARLYGAGGEEYCERTLSSRPKSLLDRLRKIETLSRAGFVQQALVQCEELLATSTLPYLKMKRSTLKLMTGAWDEAVPELIELSKIQSVRGDVLSQLAWHYERQDRLRSADSIYQLLISETLEVPFSEISRAGLKGNLGKPLESIAELKRLLEVYPNPYLYVLICRELRFLLRYEEAQKLIEVALRKWPDQIRLKVEAIEVYTRLGNAAAARKIALSMTPFQRGLEENSELMLEYLSLDDTLAIQNEATAQLRHSISGEVLQMFVHWLRERGRLDEAKMWIDSLSASAGFVELAYFKALLTSFDSPGSALDTLQTLLGTRSPVRELITAGIGYLYASGETVRARALVDSLLATQPGDHMLLLGAYGNEIGNREFSKAREIVKKLEELGLSPGMARVFELEILLEQKNLSGGAVLFEQVRKEFPRNPQNYRYMSTFYESKERCPQLLKASDEILTRSEYPYWTIAYLRTMLAMCEETARGYDYLTSLIRQYPSSAYLYFERGMLRRIAGDFAAAKQDFKQARSLNPLNQIYSQVLTESSGSGTEIGKVETEVDVDTVGLVRLTIDSILSLSRSVKPDSSYSHVVLRDAHQLFALHDRGKIRRQHRIVKAMSTYGASEIGAPSVAFRGFFESPRVILARTIRPDGKVEEVPRSGIYISSLDGDMDDNRVVQWAFPTVDSGSIVEFIIQFDQQESNSVDLQLSMLCSETVPVVSFEYELRIPRAWSLISRHSARINEQRSDQGDMHIARWSGTNLRTVESGENIPNPVEYAEWMRFAYRQSWSEVSDSYWSKISDKIDTSKATRSLANRLLRKSRTRLDSLNAIYRYVADSVRYEAISFGQGSIVPRQPASTLANGFGDCKDKTVLLMSLLTAAGIRSQAALVATYAPEWFDREIPHLWQFDHVIVYLPDEKFKWMDATCSYCGYGDLTSVLSERYALLVGGSAAERLIPIDSARSHFMGVSRRTRFEPLPTGGVKIVMDVDFQGQVAFNLSSAFFGASREDVKAFVEGQLIVGIVKGVELKSFDYTPTQGGSPFRIHAEFASQGIFMTDEFYTLVEANVNIAAVIMSFPERTVTSFDHIYEMPVRIREEFVILPGARWDQINVPITLNDTSRWFQTELTTTKQRDSLVVHVQFLMPANRIPADSIDNFLDEFKRANSRLRAQSPFYRAASDPARIAKIETAIKNSSGDISLYHSLAEEYLKSDLGGPGCAGADNRIKGTEVVRRGLSVEPKNELMLLRASALAIRANKLRLADSLLGSMPEAGQFGLFSKSLRIDVKRRLEEPLAAIALVKQLNSLSTVDELRKAMVVLYLHADSLEAAKRELLTFETVGKDSSEIRKARIIVAIHEGKWDRAEKLALESRDSSVSEKEMEVLSVWNEQEQFRKVIARMPSVLNKLPDDQKMLNTFAWALCMIDSALVPALSMIDRAIESNGGCDLSYRNTRGVVLLKLNRLDEAEAELNASLSDETVRLQSVNHFYLGQLWNKRGNKEKAKEHFTISSELRGDRKYIARAKAELEKL